jgi:NADH-quinone oxidoreductase subunit N
VGKFFLFKAAIGENLLWLAVAAIVNTVISAYYYLNVVRLMFFEPATDIAPTPSRVNGQRGLPILKAAVVVTFIMIFVIGLYPQPFIELVKQSSRLAHL